MSENDQRDLTPEEQEEYKRAFNEWAALDADMAALARQAENLEKALARTTGAEYIANRDALVVLKARVAQLSEQERGMRAKVRSPEASSGGISERGASGGDTFLARNTSSAYAALPGIPTREIIEAFTLEGKNWDDFLSRVDGAAKAYRGALAQRGGRGRGGHTWNPARFAICLLQTKERKIPGPLRRVIAEHYRDWLTEFDDLIDENGFY